MIRAGARGYSPPEMARGGGGIMSLAGARARREGHRRRHWNATERERERGDEPGRGRVGSGGVASRSSASRWVVRAHRRGEACGVWRGCGAGSDHASGVFVSFCLGLGWVGVHAAAAGEGRVCCSFVRWLLRPCGRSVSV